MLEDIKLKRHSGDCAIMQHVRVYSISCKSVTVNHSNHSPFEVEFYPMMADAGDYPEPMIPILPSASCGAWQARGDSAAGSAFLKGGETFMQGRYALLEALRRAGAGHGQIVLLPVFHCRSMVEPALLLGASPCFYPIRADLQPDFTALTRLVQESELPVAAMVLTHYFGFPNALDEAERFCALHGILLVEDCAHAFYGQTGGRLLGTVGRYAIASPWKFFPVRDGGVLRDNTGSGKARRKQQSWLAEVKAVVAILQVWGQRVRHRCDLPEVDVEALCEQAEAIMARDSKRLAEQGLKELDPARVTACSLRLTRWSVRHAAHGRVARLRRENYLRWLEGVGGLTGMQPLFPSLPEGVVPYAFPLLVDVAGMGFHLLKLAGIPLWRWEDMAVTDCAVSQDYRKRLVQLPCHQALREEELAWMIRSVRSLSARLDSRQVR